MTKAINAAVAALAALSCAVTPIAASAQGQYRDSDRDGRPDRSEWNRDRDRDGRPDQYDRRDNRRDWDGAWGRDSRGYYHRNRDNRWRYYGGRYGYGGYRGSWRTGQRFPYYRDDRYVIRNYSSYDLPPPPRGYRYYRDNNGDVVMAAIAGGVIGLIIGGALGSDRHRR